MYPELGAFFKFASYKKYDFSRHFEAFPAYLLARITWRVTMMSHFRVDFAGVVRWKTRSRFSIVLIIRTACLWFL